MHAAHTRRVNELKYVECLTCHNSYLLVNVETSNNKYEKFSYLEFIFILNTDKTATSSVQIHVGFGRERTKKKKIKHQK